MSSRTVRELRTLARDLAIRGRSKMRKADLLAAIEAVLSQHTPSTAPAASSPSRGPSPVAAAPSTPAVSARRHPHAGALPLLPPLDLPPLPEAYGVRFVAVLPRDPHAVIVVWSSGGQAELTLRLHTTEGVREVSVHGALGRFFFGDLQPDQLLRAELWCHDQPLAQSRGVALPPDAPSRVFAPLFARVDPGQPISELPADLRHGASPWWDGELHPSSWSERDWVEALATAPIGHKAPWVEPDVLPMIPPPAGHANASGSPTGSSWSA